jgi:hypothetical protein
MGPLKEFRDGFLECSEISSYHVLFKEAMRDFHSRFMFNMFLRSCNQCFQNSGPYGVRVSGVIFGFCRFHFAREEKKKHKKPEAEKVKKS